MFWNGNMNPFLCYRSYIVLFCSTFVFGIMQRGFHRYCFVCRSCNVLDHVKASSRIRGANLAIQALCSVFAWWPAIVFCDYMCYVKSFRFLIKAIETKARRDSIWFAQLPLDPERWPLDVAVQLCEWQSTWVAWIEIGWKLDVLINSFAWNHQVFTYARRKFEEIAKHWPCNPEDHELVKGYLKSLISSWAR